MKKLFLFALLPLLPSSGAALADELERQTGRSPRGIRVPGAIPPRPPSAPAGSEFIRGTAGMTQAEREQAILAQLSAGNIPDFLRQLRPVELSRTSGGGGTATIWVMPDYLAIGSDRDYVRVPVDRLTAATMARRFGFVLPTCKIVDAIHEQAELRLTPQPMKPGPEMRSSACYLAHSQRIDQQLAGHRVDRLLSGHKKDLVLTKRLARRPGRVAIYGWHRPDGRPIQPLSTVHGARYADYSHGVRLVSATALIDGAPRSVYEILESPGLADLLTDEGTIPGAGTLMTARSLLRMGDLGSPAATGSWHGGAGPKCSAEGGGFRGATEALPGSSYSIEIPGGSYGDFAHPSPASRAREAPASGSGRRGPGSGRR